MADAMHHETLKSRPSGREVEAMKIQSSRKRQKEERQRLLGVHRRMVDDDETAPGDEWVGVDEVALWSIAVDGDQESSRRTEALREGARRLAHLEAQGPLVPVAALCARIQTPASSAELWAGLRVLANLSALDREQARRVLEASPLLLALVEAPEAAVRELAAWIVANVAGHGAYERQALAQAGAFAPLFRLQADPLVSSDAVARATFALSNLIQGERDAVLEALKGGWLVRLAAVFERHGRQSADVLSELCWQCAFLTSTVESGATADELVAALDAQGLLSSLLWATSGLAEGPTYADALQEEPLVVGGRLRWAVASLRSLGNLAAKSDRMGDWLLQQRGFVARVALLAGGSDASGELPYMLRKEVLWIASNVAAGPPSQLLALVQGGLAPALVAAMRAPQFEVRQEAAFGLMNLCGDRAGLVAAVDAGAVEVFLSLLRSSVPTARIMAVDFIDRLLRASSDYAEYLYRDQSSLDVLETLLYSHPNPVVSNRIQQSLRTYELSNDM